MAASDLYFACNNSGIQRKIATYLSGLASLYLAFADSPSDSHSLSLPCHGILSQLPIYRYSFLIYRSYTNIPLQLSDISQLYQYTITAFWYIAAIPIYRYSFLIYRSYTNIPLQLSDISQLYQYTVTAFWYIDCSACCHYIYLGILLLPSLAIVPVPALLSLWFSKMVTISMGMLQTYSSATALLFGIARVASIVPPTPPPLSKVVFEVVPNTMHTDHPKLFNSPFFFFCWWLVSLLMMQSVVAHRTVSWH